jgi:uncharacterized Ntn-hydrolase superfamily protein
METMTSRQGSSVATFSIVAFDPVAGDVGVAVASKFLAAGAVVPWASAGAGAVATQSYANASFGPRGLALIRDGRSAEDALEVLLAGDNDPDRRQVGLVDVRGGSAAHTGIGCPQWAGHVVGPNFAAQGNLLAGEDVVRTMASTFRSATGALADRLWKALSAGEAAGGDSRGRQSAALLVAREKGGYLGFNDVLIDLRVDDDANPLAELARLLDLQKLYFGSSPPEEKLALEGPLLVELKAIMRRARHYHGDLTDSWDADVRRALDNFSGTENLEERFDLDGRTVDLHALTHIRTLYGEEESRG